MRLMKNRMIALIILICLVVCNAVYAESDDDLKNDRLYPPTLVATYMMWADLFGVDDISDDYSISIGDDGNAHVHADTLNIVYDDRASELVYGMLLYKYTGYTDAEMDLRAMALFAAIEYGWMRSNTQQEVDAVRLTALMTLNKMKTAMTTFYYAFQQGEIIPFFIGDQTLYSIMQVSDGSQAIIFTP